MKAYTTPLLILLALWPLAAIAQSDKEDVIYLKNGSIYRGTIIGQVPNVSYKIEILGGTVIQVAAADVDKITRENKYQEPKQMGLYYYEPVRKPKPTFPYRDKGLFAEGQVELDINGGFGIRALVGYKFNRFAFLGLGGGFNLYDLSDLIFNTRNDVFSGLYYPIYLHYSGDILKKNITPFYVLELGYAMAHYANPEGDQSVLYNYGAVQYVHGGMMGSAGFGGRFYPGGKGVMISLSAQCNLQQAHVSLQNPGAGGPAYTYTYSSAILPFAAIKFAVGILH